LVLAAVFILAAVGKLLDLRGSREAVAGFGVPKAAADVIGNLLPFGEMASGTALLVRPAAIGGAIAALTLLTAFIVGMASALSRGAAPDCHCFGAIHSEPVSASQIVRNVVLVGIALFVLIAGPGKALTSWLSPHSGAAITDVVLASFVLVSLAGTLVLLRQRSHLRGQLRNARRRAELLPPGLPVGALAPKFTVRDLDGATFTLDDLLARGLPVALVFGSPGCGPCSTLEPELPRWREALSDTVTIGLVGIGTYQRVDEVQTRTGMSIEEIYDRHPELAQENDELGVVLGSYWLKATPAAVILTPDGTIASATVDGRLGIEALIHFAANRSGAAGFAATQAVPA
jgi:peroxiredoxin